MQNQKSLAAVAAGLIVVAAGWVGLVYEGAGGSMTQAAEQFLASLSREQQGKASMAFDDPKRLDWHFIPKPERKGLQLKEMNADQRKAAHALLHSGLSEIGFEKATTIMALESILHELEKSRKGGPIRDPERYYFTIFGKPSVRGKWGWSVEGHHLSLNFVVSDGKLIAATPAFFGANPGSVASDVGVGPKKGTRTLAKEEQLAFDLLGRLSADERKVVLIADKAPQDLRGAGERQAPNTPPAGLAAQKMSGEQKELLRSMLKTYAGNMPQEVGEAWLGEIERAGFEKVHFAWAGADKPGVGHYYRVQGPTFVLEFVNVQADSAGNPANHIHSVWRSLAGDFGVSI